MTSIDRVLCEFVGTGDLDKYAFADERPDLKKKGVSEPDNALERGLLRAITSYVNINKPLSDSACEKIRGYRRAGLYKDVFADVPSGVESLYRGVSLEEEHMRKLVGESRLQEKSSGHHEGKFVWLPRSGTQACSWSVSRAEAEMVMFLSDRPYEVIMRANVRDIDSDACVSFVNGLYKLASVSHMNHEEEVLTFGSVSVSEIWWTIRP